MKKCSKCSEQKPLDLFYRRSNGKYHEACKECIKAQNKRRYYGANRDEIRENCRQYSVEYRAKLKDEAFRAYGGYVCTCCGEKEQKFLTLDHVNNDGAEFRRKIAGKRSAAGYPTYRWLRQNGFPSGYQVLCMNCNHGKRMNNGTCPHQVRCNDYPLGE